MAITKPWIGSTAKEETGKANMSEAGTVLSMSVPFWMSEMENKSAGNGNFISAKGEWWDSDDWGDIWFESWGVGTLGDDPTTARYGTWTTQGLFDGILIHGVSVRKNSDAPTTLQPYLILSKKLSKKIKLTLDNIEYCYFEGGFLQNGVYVLWSGQNQMSSGYAKRMQTAGAHTIKIEYV